MIVCAKIVTPARVCVKTNNSLHPSPKASLTRWLFHLVGIPTAHLANNLPTTSPAGTPDN